MFRAFLAVLRDLADFITLSVRRRVHQSVPDTRVMLLPEARPDDVSDGTVTVQDRSETVLFGLQSSYVTTPQACVFVRPVWAFDTVVAMLPAATAVHVDTYEGRFAHIRREDLSGWVLKDDLSREPVWPHCIDRCIYEASHDVTERIRTLIVDEFFARELYLPLQPQEFIMVRLKARGQTLPSVSARPRLVGEWHLLYRGVRGVNIGLEPRTGSVMEAVRLDREPFLAFVTAVHVDESIVIESVGRYREGEYRTEVLTANEWRELQPVFILF